MQDQQKPFSEFQQVAAVETCDKFRYKSFLKPCLYSTWFTFIEFVLKLVVACSFLVARIIKNTLRKPFEFKWPEVRFNRKRTSMTRVPYNKLLTNLASSSRIGDYWPSVVLYEPRCTRSILSRPRANIPQVIWWRNEEAWAFSNRKFGRHGKWSVTFWQWENNT